MRTNNIKKIRVKELLSTKIKEQIVTNHKLNDLFEIPENHIVSAGDKNYIGSLTPNWEKMRNISHININLVLKVPNNFKLQVQCQNDINTHIFKPKFFVKKRGILECYVPNKEVMSHTLRALAITAHHLKLNPISVTVQDTGDHYSNYTNGWVINDHVIICRVESFINFLRIMWLKEKGVSAKLIKQFAIHTESQRVDPNSYKELTIIKSMITNGYGINMLDFEKDYCIETQPTSSNYIYSTNINYKGKKISLVQLTWGYSQSCEMFDTLMELNPNIIKIGSIGGVGYSRNDDMKIDDVFLPISIASNNNEEGIFFRKLKNDLVRNKNANIFSKKSVTKGTIRTVVPTLGVFSNTSKLRSHIDQIHAFDMELEAFADKLDQHDNIISAFSYYIMDLPFKGYGLGNTYYNKSFLKRLYSKFNRGKYQCFEYILNFIIDNSNED